MGRVNDMIVAAAVNDRTILENCLRRSPEVAEGKLPLTVLEGYSSASIAYNEVLHAAPPGTIVILCHQDVYLPRGYSVRLQERIDELERSDPNWGVLGLTGRTADGEFAGRVWSTAADKLHQNDVSLPAPIVTADEQLLVIRAGADLFFDEKLPGFHIYGTDIIQTALDLGRISYAVDAPAIHHDKPVINLDRGYRKAYRYLQKKWWDRLPIPSLIAPLTRSFLTLYEYNLRIRYIRRGARRRIVPTSDPSEIASRLGLE
jgi:hypothetical protein